MTWRKWKSLWSDRHGFESQLHHCTTLDDLTLMEPWFQHCWREDELRPTPKGRESEMNTVCYAHKAPGVPSCLPSPQEPWPLLGKRLLDTMETISQTVSQHCPAIWCKFNKGSFAASWDHNPHHTAGSSQVYRALTWKPSQFPLFPILPCLQPQNQFSCLSGAFQQYHFLNQFRSESILS